MKEDKKQQLDALLKPEEEILWTGKPEMEKRKLFTTMDLVNVPFSILWMFGSIFMLIQTIISADVAQILFSLLLFILGLYFLVGRLLLKKYIWENSIYAVTNQRIITLRAWMKKVRSLDKVPKVSKTIRADATGSLVFDNLSYSSAEMVISMSGSLFPSNRLLAFENISDADQVYHLVKDLQKNARKEKD